MTRSFLIAGFLAGSLMNALTAQANLPGQTSVSGTWFGTFQSGQTLALHFQDAHYLVNGSTPAGHFTLNGRPGDYAWETNGWNRGVIHTRVDGVLRTFSVELGNANTAMRLTFGGEQVTLTRTSQQPILMPPAPHVVPPPAPPARSMEWKVIPGRGYYVTHVYPGGRAERRGIRTGDWIVAVNGISLSNPIAEMIAGVTVALRDMRARVDIERPGFGRYQLDLSQ